MVLQYKCPNCGADMVFDSKSGKLVCASCGRQETIGSLPRTTEESADGEYSDQEADQDIDEDFGDYEDFNSETASNTFNGEAVEYVCNNCGAHLITDENTTASSCGYCGAAVILGDRLSGSLAPAKIVPFAVSKDEAQSAFKKWCGKGLLSPKEFKAANRLKGITGIYIPYWLFDLNGRGEVRATCTKVRTYTQGDYLYTETKYYDVYRKADLRYADVPADASEKMNDTMMNKLEPFHYQDMKEFNTPYLAGYQAEKYDFTDSDVFPAVKERAEKYVNQYLSSTITGYSHTHYDQKWIDVRQRKADYTLMPVWMVCYDFQHMEHSFIMNGQTGKIVGTPPLSKGKAAAWFAGISAGLFLIFKLISILMGGALL